MAIVEQDDEDEEEGKDGVEAVGRPTSDEIELENNPRMKAGDKATEKLMRGKVKK